MVYRRKNIPPGPKSVFNRSLGGVIGEGLSVPKPIHALIKERPVKRLLNWMAMDEAFKAKILGQVPVEDPPEPEQP